MVYSSTTLTLGLLAILIEALRIPHKPEGIGPLNLLLPIYLSQNKQVNTKFVLGKTVLVLGKLELHEICI